MDINCILIGLGGTGGWLAEPLYRYLYHECNGNLDLTLIDGDIVEEKNTIRQPFDLEHEHSSKAFIIYKRLSSIFNDGRLRFYDQYLRTVDKSMLSRDKFNIVISAVDNKRSRQLHLRSLIASKRDFLYVTPGNETWDGQIISYAYQNGQFIGDNPLDIWYSDDLIFDDVPKKDGCFNKAREVPQLINANMMSAVLCINVIHNFLQFGVLQSYLVFDNKLNNVKVMNEY